MKIYYLLILFLFLLINDCFSQDSSAKVFYLNKLSAEGILLDKGWKFKLDDNPDYAKPECDDKAWQYIDPTLDIHNSLKIIIVSI